MKATRVRADQQETSGDEMRAGGSAKRRPRIRLAGVPIGAGYSHVSNRGDWGYPYGTPAYWGFPYAWGGLGPGCYDPFFYGMHPGFLYGFAYAPNPGGVNISGAAHSK